MIADKWIVVVAMKLIVYIYKRNIHIFMPFVCGQSESDKAKGGVSVIKLLFRLTSLCGWPCSHSALLSRLWQKLIEDNSLRLSSGAINLLADLLMENLTTAQSLESKRYAPMCLSFLVSSNSANADGIINRILAKNVRNFEILDQNNPNAASNAISDNSDGSGVLAWDNSAGLSDGEVNMRELAAISLLIQVFCSNISAHPKGRGEIIKMFERLARDFF